MKTHCFNWLLCAGCAVGMAGAPAHGQARIFLQRAGDEPTGVPAGGATITSPGGETITFDVYVENAPAGSRVKGLSVMLPCNATGGDSGSVHFLPPILVDTERPDYLYFGHRFCRQGPNIGVACATDADCLNPTPFADCTTGSYDAGSDDGNCGANPPPPPASGNPRSYATVLVAGTAVVVTTPRYIGTSYHYAVSSDASGTFVIAPTDVFPATQLSDQDDMQIPFSTSGVTIDVPTGKCCVGNSCAGEMNGFSCNALGGVLGVGLTCADPCCASYADCNDSNTCTFESCQSGSCQGYPVEYGNVNGVGVVDVDDLLCMARGFGGFATCPNGDLHPPCTGDGIINLDDIIKFNNAFGGFDPCGCNP